MCAACSAKIGAARDLEAAIRANTEALLATRAAGQADDGRDDHLSISTSKLGRPLVDGKAVLEELREARAKIEKLEGELATIRPLADAMRASGITPGDCDAVATLYATAGEAWTHRIVSAATYLARWLRATAEKEPAP